MPKKENILRKFAFGGDLGCCVAQMGCVEISRVQRSSVGFSIPQVGNSLALSVQDSSEGCSISHMDAVWLSMEQRSSGVYCTA